MTNSSSLRRIVCLRVVQDAHKREMKLCSSSADRLQRASLDTRSLNQSQDALTYTDAYTNPDAVHACIAGTTHNHETNQCKNPASEKINYPLPLQ